MSYRRERLANTLWHAARTQTRKKTFVHLEPSVHRSSNLPANRPSRPCTRIQTFDTGATVLGRHDIVTGEVSESRDNKKERKRKNKQTKTTSVPWINISTNLLIIMGSNEEILSTLDEYVLQVYSPEIQRNINYKANDNLIFKYEILKQIPRIFCLNMKLSLRRQPARQRDRDIKKCVVCWREGGKKTCPTSALPFLSQKCWFGEH